MEESSDHETLPLLHCTYVLAGLVWFYVFVVLFVLCWRTIMTCLIFNDCNQAHFTYCLIWITILLRWIYMKNKCVIMNKTYFILTHCYCENNMVETFGHSDVQEPQQANTAACLGPKKREAKTQWQKKKKKRGGNGQISGQKNY